MSDIDREILNTIEKGFKELNKTVSAYLRDMRDDSDNYQSQGNVTFRFPANSHEVLVMSKRNEMLLALEKLADYRRELERYSVPGEIYIQEGKVLSDEELNDYNRTMEDAEKTKSYVEVQSVIDKIDDLLDGMYSLFGY